MNPHRYDQQPQQRGPRATLFGPSANPDNPYRDEKNGRYFVRVVAPVLFVLGVLMTMVAMTPGLVFAIVMGDWRALIITSTTAIVFWTCVGLAIRTARRKAIDEAHRQRYVTSAQGSQPSQPSQPRQGTGWDWDPSRDDYRF